jgi:GDP/UDP-N,N'-diacetylbacillosamine 2-epimerase (hydrolysing)
MKKKIAILCSSRASYGYEKGIVRRVHESDSLELQLIVTGIHLLPEHGYSLKEIADDGFPIAAKVEMMVGGDSPAAWAKSLGLEITNLSQVFSMLEPDFLVLTGDRGETLGAAVAASYMNIPIGHIQAGDISGHIDGSARHAITKLSHLFFASCPDSAERVRKLGEEDWRIYDVGSPQLDILVETPNISKQELGQFFGFDFSKPVLVLIQHAVLSEIDEVRKQMVETMEAIKKLGMQTVAIYPNNDAGGRVVIDTLRDYAAVPHLKCYENIERPVLINLLRNASAIVGNSSCGILEGPFLKLPAINIGSRQNGRLRSENLIDVPHDRDAIVGAVKLALSDQDFRQRLSRCENPYGDGHSSEKIVDIITNLDVSRSRLLEKRMTY